MRIGGSIALLAALALVSIGRASAQDSRLLLADGWHLQSSSKVEAAGATISTPAYQPDGWYRTSVPSTVVAALVANNVYPDPFFGMNLRGIPGTSYPIGRNFSPLPMPPDSPFRVSWWYRTSFSLPSAARGRRVALPSRRHQLPRERLAERAADRAGGGRGRHLPRLRVRHHPRGESPAGPMWSLSRCFRPNRTTSAWNWVDWNPSPPDKNMGLLRPVSVTTSGDVVLRSSARGHPPGSGPRDVRILP